MNIHKFNVKSIYNPTKTIKWMVPDNIRQYVKKVNITTWEIFSQEDITLKPKEVKFIMLGIGFIMSEGVVVDRICGVWLSLCVCVLLASCVSRLSVCVSRLRAFVSRASRVCVHLSRVRLASVCVCSRQGFRMRASASASVSHLSRVCRLVSVCVYLSCVCASVRLSRVLSRVCLASVSRLVSHLSSCLASVVLSRVCLSPCECLRELAHFMSVVIQGVQKVFCYRHTIL